MLVTAGLFAWRMMSRDSETAEARTERAHRLCTECDLSRDEIDRLIDSFTDKSLTREEAVRLFEDTYSDPVQVGGSS